MSGNRARALASHEARSESISCFCWGHKRRLWYSLRGNGGASAASASGSGSNAASAGYAKYSAKPSSLWKSVAGKELLLNAFECDALKAIMYVS